MMYSWFRFPLFLFSLGLIMLFFGCGRSRTPEEKPPATDVVLYVPAMHWPVGWPDRVRNALATLPWVEQKTIQTDTDKREVRFDLKDKKGFNEEEVKNALKEKGFKEVTVKSVPQWAEPGKE